MNALMGEEGDLILNSGGYGEPVECLKGGSDVVIFTHPHQDPCSTVLDVLKLLNTEAGDPDEECVAVVQPGGDKGMD